MWAAVFPSCKLLLTNLMCALHTCRSEQEREADLHPGGGYLAEAESEACVTPQMRMIVTSWMCEVACEFTLQQETLFLAVELLDRFLAASPVSAAGRAMCSERALKTQILQV